MLAWEALCPGKPFVLLRGPFVYLKGSSFGINLLGLTRPYVGLKVPCATLRGSSFGLRRPLFAHDGVLLAKESPVLF